eukprot:scaffold895_cov315-Pinguiococcus_pyrenoidosus.AAC.78
MATATPEGGHWPPPGGRPGSNPYEALDAVRTQPPSNAQSFRETLSGLRQTVRDAARAPGDAARPPVQIPEVLEAIEKLLPPLDYEDASSLVFQADRTALEQHMELLGLKVQALMTHGSNLCTADANNRKDPEAAKLVLKEALEALDHYEIVDAAYREREKLCELHDVEFGTNPHSTEHFHVPQQRAQVLLHLIQAATDLRAPMSLCELHGQLIAVVSTFEGDIRTLRSLRRDRFQALAAESDDVRAAFADLGECEEALGEGRRASARRDYDAAFRHFLKAAHRGALEGLEESEAKALYNCAWMLFLEGKALPALSYITPCCRIFHSLGEESRIKFLVKALFLKVRILKSLQRWTAARACTRECRKESHLGANQQKIRELEREINEEIAKSAP